jgi:hypothetical protein
VDIVFAVSGVADEDRLTALQELVRLGDQNTRYRILGSIHKLAVSDRNRLLAEMVITGQHDDPTRDEARDLLVEQAD